MGVCAWAGVPAAPRHSWLGCWGVCVLVCALPLYPATPGWGVQCGCRCFGSGIGCAPPLLAGVLGCAWLCACSPCTPPLLAGMCGVRVCVWVRVSAAIRYSWLGCWGVCVLVWAPPLYPATPGWGVRCGRGCLGSDFGCAPPLLAGVLGCVCLCACSPCTPSLLAGVCGVRVCVLGSGFGCAPPPGWGVGVCLCTCARSACTPPLRAGVCSVGVGVWARASAAPRHSWLGCWGVRVCVRAPPVPRHSWLGCAVWVCVLGLDLRLRPATPGSGAGVCVGWCARSACTPPLLARVCSVGVGVWARVSAAPRHSWLGCWGVRGCVRAPLVPRHSWLGCAACVCVFGFRFPLRPATPGWVVGACLFVCVLPLYPVTPGWAVRRGCVCLGLGFGCASPLQAGLLGCVCAGVRAPLVPRHSWLGCAVWVCVFGLGFPLRPATPGWGVGVCVCWCPRSTCTSPLLAGVCGVCVCVWARVSAAPQHTWLGSWGFRFEV